MRRADGLDARKNNDGIFAEYVELFMTQTDKPSPQADVGKKPVAVY